MGQRHAGGQHQGVELRPVGVGEVNQGQALGRGGVPGGGVLVPKGDLGPARLQGAGSRQPGAAQAEHRDALAFKSADGDHLAGPPYRSFRVASPMRASTMATIQKRTTTVDSAQPSFSKW